MLARGEIRRIGPDRYALPVTELGPRLAAELNAHLSHLSAALAHGWEVLHPPGDPQLVLPVGRPHPGQIGGHLWWYDARPADLSGWTTGPELTVLLCARDLPFAEALGVADSALRHGATDEARLRAALARWRGGHHERVATVLRHANPKAANPFESALRALQLEAGFDLVPQYEVRVGRQVFHPDLVDPLRGSIVEGDSWSFHADREQHDRDCRRYTLLTADGWRVLRFTYDDVMSRPEYVVACVRAVYRAATA